MWETGCGNCGLRTVNLCVACGQITSEYVHVLRDCPTRVSHKSVPQECCARVSREGEQFSTRASHKSVLQHCPTRGSCESVPQERCARVSPTGVSKGVKQCLGVRFHTCLHSGSWAQSCFFSHMIPTLKAGVQSFWPSNTQTSPSSGLLQG